MHKWHIQLKLNIEKNIKSQENKDNANKQGNKNTRYRCTNPQSQHK